MTTENKGGRDVVACALGQEALVERQQRWQALAARAGLDIVSSDSGARLIFRADRSVEMELRELGALERECCAFADWSVRSDDGEVVLDVRGESDEAIAAVQGMFRGLRANSTAIWASPGAGAAID
jgi:hypothetical protein